MFNKLSSRGSRSRSLPWSFKLQVLCVLQSRQWVFRSCYWSTRRLSSEFEKVQRRVLRRYMPWFCSGLWKLSVLRDNFEALGCGNLTAIDLQYSSDRTKRSANTRFEFRPVANTIIATCTINILSSNLYKLRGCKGNMSTFIWAAMELSRDLLVGTRHNWLWEWWLCMLCSF